MAVVYLDGFDHGDVTQCLLRFDTNNGTSRFSKQSSRTGTGLRIQNNSGSGIIEKNVPAAVTYYVGFAMYADYVGDFGTDQGILSFMEGSGMHVDLRFSTVAGSSTFRVTRNGTSLGTGSVVMNRQVWYYIEMKATIHDSTGAITVRINESDDISLTNIDTRNGGTSGVIDRIRFWNSASSGSQNPGLLIDDVYVDDTQFHGDCKVELALPTGAGTTTQFTPSTGSNFQNVDDTAADDDSTYNASSTPGNIDTFQLGNLSTVSGSVKAVQVTNKWRKDDAGARTGKAVVRAGSTNYEGSSVAITDSYDYSHAVFNTNPDTSTAWTISDVNGLEAGYKIEA